MGLKTRNYNVEDMGIALSTAYAQITHLSINIDGTANAIFAIQQSRGAITSNVAVDTKYFRCEIDKKQPIYEQIYVKAKDSVFQGWEDDIVESEVDA